MTNPEKIHVLNERVPLLQPAEGFRTSLDSVMLAAACPAGKGESILDLGCGVGGASFCTLHRVPETTLTGIDIQEDHIALAMQNAAMNDMSARTEFIGIDVRDFDTMPSPRKRGSLESGEKDPCLRRENTVMFDHVICNPPYLEAGAHTPSPSAPRALAIGHGEDDIELKDWIDAGFRNLKSKGSFTIIHRADQTDEIIRAMGRRFGAIEIIPLWPRQGIEAKRAIIRAIKDRRSPAKIHPGIILHQDNGDYTSEAEKILRQARPIL